MRAAAVVFSLVALLLPAVAGAERPRGGSLSVVEMRGVVNVKGRGALLGRLDAGSLLIADLTPNDQWSPRVNGVPRGRLFTHRGRDITFYIPAGRYRIVIRGEGISLSARGSGMASLDGEPDPTGSAGTYAVGDDARKPVPDEPIRVGFGQEPSVPPQPARSDG